MLATLLKLGYEAADGEYRVMSGINGDTSKGERSIAVWAGGKAVDAESASADETPARFVIRHDGTAYACDNEVRFDSDHIEVGESTVLDKDGLKLFSDAKHTNCVLQVINSSVGEDFPNEGVVRIIPDTNVNAGNITIARRRSSSGMVSSSYFVSQTSLPTPQSLGSFSAGERLRLSASVSFNSPVASTGGTAVEIDGTADLAISRNRGSLAPIEIERQTVRLTNAGGVRWTAAFSIDVVMPADGVYYISGGVNPISVSGAVETVGIASTSLGFEGTATLGVASQSVLGNDGLVSVWGNAAMLIRKEMVGMMFGRVGLRITGKGIEVTAQGSSGWREIDVSKLPFKS